MVSEMQTCEGIRPTGWGLPSQVEIHGKVPIITKIFDDSGSLIILSRTGFPTQLNHK